MRRKLDGAVDSGTEDSVFMVPVETGHVAEEPSSRPLGFVVFAPLIEPHWRLREINDDGEPYGEECKLRIEGLAETVGVSLLSALLFKVEHTLLMMSRVMAQSSCPKAKKNA